jgi:4-alpha-glucanotransferase
MKLFRIAFAKFDNTDKEYDKFLSEEAGWIYDFAKFAALRERNGRKPWNKWTDFECDENEENFNLFLQYTFYKQWYRIKKYANDNGILIVGDIPIYVAYDSADVWADTEQFLLDENKLPTEVAGVPPDYFSKTGQLWGNPLYNWEKMNRDGYSWWLKRIEKSMQLYDVLRIDHFRAFDTYYAVPYGNPTAEHGQWKVGPRMDLWNAVFGKFGRIPIIAEDLGEIFDSVKELLRNSGFPGMKVFQFGFGGDDSFHLPHNYTQNSVAYTGTHDNSTLLGWIRAADKKSVSQMKNYVRPNAFEHPAHAAVRSLFASSADTVIVPMQDVLILDDKSRMNTPGTVGGSNWRWRMKSGADSMTLAKGLASLSDVYFRNMEQR